jgi:hypothetical protein
MRRRRRLYLADLDSVRQAAAVPGSAETWRPRIVPERLRGIVRMAVLIGGQVVVTDSQLLDGRVFVALGPTHFGDLVPADHADGQWPLEVCVRGESLTSSLAEMLAPRDACMADPMSKLVPYEFSIVEDTALRRHVAREIGRHTVRDLRAAIAADGPIAGVIGLLRDSGLPAAQAGAIGRQWAAWCSADDRFRVVPNVVPPHALGGAADPTSRQLITVALSAVDAPRACFAALDRIASDSDVSSRSRAYGQVLEPLRKADRANEVGAELLRVWVDAWYHRSTAQAIDADVIESNLNTAALPDRQWDSRHWLTVDPGIADDLGQMPREVFAGLRYRSRHDTSAWWNDRRRSLRGAQRRLALLIEQETEQLSFGRLVGSGVSKVIVLMAAVLITAIEVHGWVKALVLVAAALFAAGPEAYELWRLRGRRLDRRFSVVRR